MSESRATQNQDFQPCSALWPLLVLLVSTVWPRMLALGDFPHMDEGFYAYWAQFIHQNISQGHGVPDSGVLFLYPLLFSWLGGLPGNTLVWLRLADMLVALWAGWLFCRLWERESRSAVAGLLLGLAFLSVMNTPAVIDAGFKNSIFAAYVPLLLALRLTDADGSSRARWFAAGALTALGVLLREPLVGFALLGAGSIWLGRGFKAFCQYAAGGLLCGALLLGLSGALRGGFTTLLQAYLAAGDIYAQEAGRVAHNFYVKGGAFLVLAWPVFLLCAIGLGLICCCRGHKPWGRALFWLGLTLFPLLEPISKLGFVYHFAVSLPGCAGLCALAWGRRKDFPPRLPRAAAVCAALLCLFQTFMVLPGIARARVSLEVLRPWPVPAWPMALTPFSNTLLASDALRAVLPPNGSLSVSAFAFFLYPVTGALPPEASMSDLSRTFITEQQDTARLAAALRANPPDVLAIGFAASEHAASFTPEITRAVEQSGLYTLIKTIPVDKGKNYGWMGYDIYVRKPGPERPSSLRGTENSSARTSDIAALQH